MFAEGFNVTGSFPAIDHYFEETVVETGGEFSIIYIFITLFVNDMYFKVFHCIKTKQDISKPYFYFFFCF